MIVDATGAIAGKLAAFCAKRALLKESVIIVNGEKAIISGDPVRIVSVYKKRRGMINKSNPEHAAKWPRRPDLFLKKIIKGMLPKERRGKEAASRIKVFMGVPEKYEGKAEKFPITSKHLYSKFISVGDICKSLGWNK